MRPLLVVLVLLLGADEAAARRWRDRIVPPTGNPAHLVELSLVGTWAFGVGFCSAVSPMLSSVIKGRELSLKEAWTSVAGCFLPIVGGWIVRRHFPERWNKLPMKRHDLDFGIGAIS